MQMVNIGETNNEELSNLTNEASENVREYLMVILETFEEAAQKDA